MREFTLVFPYQNKEEKKKLFYLAKIVFYDFVIIVINPKHKHETKIFWRCYNTVAEKKNDGVLIYSFQNHQRVVPNNNIISYVTT